MEHDGGLKTLQLYVIGNIKQGGGCEYFENFYSAFERFQEACGVHKAQPAFGIRVEDGSIDLLHGVGGQAVLVPDYRKVDGSWSEPTKGVLDYIKYVTQWFVEVKQCVKYEYQNDLLPVQMRGDVKVLVPVTLDGKAPNSYCNDKVLKASQPDGLDAIDSLFIEYHGWVAYQEVLRHPKEYAPDGVLVVPALNVVYVNDKNVVGIDGRMDVAPADFRAMVGRINKPYSLVVYDGLDYKLQFQGRHEFIVGSYGDLSAAVKGWYELRAKHHVPAVIMGNEAGKREVLFKGLDENGQKLSYQQAAEKFGIEDSDGIGAVIIDAECRARELTAEEGAGQKGAGLNQAEAHDGPETEI